MKLSYFLGSSDLPEFFFFFFKKKKKKKKLTVYPKKKSISTPNHIRESPLFPKTAKVALFKNIKKKLRQNLFPNKIKSLVMTKKYIHIKTFDELSKPRVCLVLTKKYKQHIIKRPQETQNIFPLKPRDPYIR